MSTGRPSKLVTTHNSRTLANIRRNDLSMLVELLEHHRTCRTLGSCRTLGLQNLKWRSPNGFGADFRTFAASSIGELLAWPAWAEWKTLYKVLPSSARLCKALQGSSKALPSSARSLFRARKWSPIGGQRLMRTSNKANAQCERPKRTFNANLQSERLMANFKVGVQGLQNLQTRSWRARQICISQCTASEAGRKAKERAWIAWIAKFGACSPSERRWPPSSHPADG